jgi:hypothetical protein
LLHFWGFSVFAGLRQSIVINKILAENFFADLTRSNSHWKRSDCFTDILNIEFIQVHIFKNSMCTTQSRNWAVLKVHFALDKIESSFWTLSHRSCCRDSRDVRFIYYCIYYKQDGSQFYVQYNALKWYSSGVAVIKSKKLDDHVFMQHF